jgi:hypothetical protein
MPTFRQCATGIVISGNAWWLGVHTAGTSSFAPVFEPAIQARPIENFNQDRPGQDYWRWSGALTGDRTVLRLSRGDCLDVFLPGNRTAPSFMVDQWAPGDWDFSGVVNSADISAFLLSWVQSLNSPVPAGDYNLDGIVNSADISAFLTSWLSR